MDKASFDLFLRWLNPDRELAAKKYELIRRKLIVIFTARERQDPEKMTDDCIDIVARKLPEIAGNYEGDPEFYFLGVAKMMNKKADPKVIPLDDLELSADPGQTENGVLYDCLEHCLAQLDAASRDLILEYSRHRGRTKIDHHNALAKQLGIAVNALRIRAYRIRKTLETCVKHCSNGA